MSCEGKIKRISWAGISFSPDERSTARRTFQAIVLQLCPCRFKMSPFCRNKMSPDCRFRSDVFSCSAATRSDNSNLIRQKLRKRLPAIGPDRGRRCATPGRVTTRNTNLRHTAVARAFQTANNRSKDIFFHFN